jgi:phosphoribosylanthranilate isomerase
MARPDASPARCRIKICGVTDPAEARAVEAAGADWIGLNFYPPSPRYVDPPRAGAILDAMADRARAVGLFVGRPAAEIREGARRLGLGVVQLHGDEPPEILPELEGLTVVKAFRIRDVGSLLELQAFLERALELGRLPDVVLVDAHVPGVPGGTGRGIADDLLPLLPPLPRLALAGGLTPENVADRVRAVRPWMVDVAGGVEAAPGRKDPGRVAAFVAAVRSCADADGGGALPPVDIR